MTRILEALRNTGIHCHAPKDADSIVLDGPEEDRRPAYTPFEDPPPSTEQLFVQESRPDERQLFRFFIDGSMRTTSAGYVTDGEGRYLPIFIEQIAVAATCLEDGSIKVEDYESRNVFFLPDTFPEADRLNAQHVVTEAARSSRYPLALEFECYSLEQGIAPLDSARKRMLSSMHDKEIALIEKLAATKASRDDLLMIDGSLQFYHGLEQARAREAFRNVVGVAKSFDLNDRVGSSRNAKQVGTLVAGLRHQHRTPARKISVARTNRAIGAWYLRLRTQAHQAGLAVDDGVVKLELFPDDALGSDQGISTDRCDLISRNVLALRHPTTPSTDERWASHLYPIHLTERYIRTRFRDDRTIRAYL